MLQFNINTILFLFFKFFVYFLFLFFFLFCFFVFFFVFHPSHPSSGTNYLIILAFPTGFTANRSLMKNGFPLLLLLTTSGTVQWGNSFYSIEPKSFIFNLLFIRSLIFFQIMFHLTIVFYRRHETI